MSKVSQNLFLHADGDSFFVACEISQNPLYKRMPVVVGEDRGIAVAMSYEAKKLGVTRGMPVFKIKKQFPKVIILPHHFDLYRKISDTVYNIILSYLESVEVYSIDECFAIVKHSDIVHAGGADKLLKTIKEEIQNTLGVTYSFGLGRTKALAKTASKLEKPNGVVWLLSLEDEERALKNTSIDDVWGIGRQTIPRLRDKGIRTAYDFVKYSSEQIEKYFPTPLYHLQQELSGISMYEFDANPDPRDQKSIQSTATFKPPSNDSQIIFAELSENVENACVHARRLHLMTNSVSFFIKNTNFVHYTDDCHLPLYTNSPSVILNKIEPLLYKLLKSEEKIRSTGITLRNLRRKEEVPNDLFGTQNISESKNIIEEVSDKIRDKFGHNAIKHASSLRGNGRQRGNSFPGVH